jgi:hypothetical protein
MLVPSGAMTNFRPPRRRMEIGTRTVTVRPSSSRLSAIGLQPPTAAEHPSQLTWG